MAEGDDQKNSEDTNPGPTDSEEPLTLDLGIDPAKNYEKIDNDEDCAAAASLSVSNEAPRREENPFSFKHFLRGDTTYQSQGARPKVYCDGRQIASVSDLELNSTTSSSSLDNKSTRIVNELSSGLPDFVQDHLVIEQSYLAQATTSTSRNTSPTQPILTNAVSNHHPIIAGLGGGNLPDFTRDSSPGRLNATNSASEDDTSIHSRNGILSQGIARPQPEFPLDLPLPVVIGNRAGELPLIAIETDQHTSHNAGVLSNTNPLLLPDFLTDASRLPHLTNQQQPNLTNNITDATAELACATAHQHHHHQNGHNHPPTLDLPLPHLPTVAGRGGGPSTAADSCKVDGTDGGLVEAFKRQVAEQSRRITGLNDELEMTRQREQEWAIQRTKLEDNLEMSNIRAASAESTILQMKQEIKSLSAQVTVLVRENSSFRSGEGASCSNISSTRTSAALETQVQHFAQELRGAATNAERNLRQLLSGVDNLRMMASFMETSFGVAERPYQTNQEHDSTARAEFK